ncbi:MAG: hypothetical protein LLG06_15475 [Desulfobacteraceae bacterium]|nr:hypothetical protein [Desulfobacteraceae bacterium]
MNQARRHNPPNTTEFRKGTLAALCALLCVLLVSSPSFGQNDAATITVDAGAPSGRLNPQLFGQNVLITNGFWSTRSGGIDAAAVPLLKNLSPTVLRFPGGSVSDQYIWEDGVGVRAAKPIEGTGGAIVLDEAPNWQGVRKVRLLAPGHGMYGDVIAVQGIRGNNLSGVWGSTATWPAGTVLRPEGRIGLPDWMVHTYGILEHMQVASFLGASAIITVNYGTGVDRSGAVSTGVSLSQKTKRAAAFVALCNGNPSDTRPLGKDDEGNDWQTVGYWAGKRASRGHPQPFGVSLWEVGNEVFDQNEKGYTPVRKYAQEFVLFARAMKAVDPSIKVGAVGVSSPQGKGDADSSDPWNPTLLQTAINDMDFFIIHSYYPAATRKKADYSSREWFGAVMASAEQTMTELRGVRSMLDARPPKGKSMPLALTEYGIWPIDSTSGADFSNIARATYDMDLMAGLIKESGSLGLNLVTAWNLFGSNTTAHIRHDWKTGSRLLRPQYHAYKTARDSLQPLVVPSQVTCPSFSTAQVGNLLQRANIPLVNAVATLSEDRRKLTVMIVNRSLSKPLPCAIRISGFAPQSLVLQTLAGPEPGANNETNGKTVVPESRSFTEPTFNLSLPPHSITFAEYRGK